VHIADSAEIVLQRPRLEIETRWIASAVRLFEA
jgi:hypothetical protein